MTYALLSAAFVAVAAVVAAIGWRRAPRGHGLAVFVSALALVVLTIVFDSIMIATGLFDYADAHIWGVRLGLAPIEDLAYPIAGVLLLSGLWNLMGERADAD
ncbi:lycopene cyclase domain-containing protein [Agromyces cerinus]|uniref:Lycopene cyclase domain-containing protein n=1 Tax=Agromyces cerinus subsp. cerinus TaxID=232089 RepID=A0A1N6GCA0_9MICO|nr:lycopene cyclase domain-containing protein [Agromyces cerinus]SIO05133.1 lycopene cyclase domain-containing protein [Agromyces cerinus subsp. cerinus]